MTEQLRAKITEEKRHTTEWGENEANKKWNKIKIVSKEFFLHFKLEI